MAHEARLIRLFLCGDVMSGRGVDQILPHPGGANLHETFVASALDYVRLAEARNGPIPRPASFSYPWGAALDELERVRPDARIVNLETSVTTSEAFEPKGINYRMSPANIEFLKAAKLDVCALANNHVLDWGSEGLIETLDALRDAGVKYAGAGRGAREAEAAAAVDLAAGARVLVFALASSCSGVPHHWAAGSQSPGVNLVELSAQVIARVARQVSAMKRPGDVVVASIHWGGNWGYGVPHAQQAFAHTLIDAAGVDLVHGHSSHHVKAIEAYRGKLVLYGCGDFLNDYEGISGYEEYRGDLALMYFPILEAATGRLIDLTMKPLQMRRFRLEKVALEDAVWLRNRLSREGGKFGNRVELGGGRDLKLRWSER